MTRENSSKRVRFHQSNGERELVPLKCLSSDISAFSKVKKLYTLIKPLKSNVKKEKKIF